MSTTTAKVALGHNFFGFDHIHFYVGNAKLLSEYYCSAFGFEKVAFRGLETGYRSSASHVIRNNNIIFVFTTPYSSNSKGEYESDDINEQLTRHGEGVKDVAFRVLDCRLTYNEAVHHRGAIGVREPIEVKDNFGTVVLATLKTYGDTVHTLVERKNYKGVFLPGFVLVHNNNKMKSGTVPDLRFIDHVVGNQEDGKMTAAADWYRDKLDFHRFWSVDDKQIHTQYSALRSIVMADESLSIKMPINEPASGLRKSQIQEYVEFYQGAGVQHIALNTPNCVETVTRLKDRGVEFLETPPGYYENLKIRLAKANIKVGHDMDKLKELNILVDFDETGYLLQIFTKPLQDRPTVFIEIIQRAGNQGFGAGNFKALFEAIERGQQLRGNL